MSLSYHMKCNTKYTITIIQYTPYNSVTENFKLWILMLKQKLIENSLPQTSERGSISLKSFCLNFRGWKQRR